MSENTEYNGWANWQTWRTASFYLEDETFFNKATHIAEVAEGDRNLISKALHAVVENQMLEPYRIISDAVSWLMQDAVLSFLDEVNWLEVADYFVDQYNEANA